MKEIFESKVNVEDQKQGGFSVDQNKDSIEEEANEKIEQKRVAAQDFVRENAESLALFTGDASLDYVASDGFYYLPENDEVHYDLNWFTEQDYSKEQILWALKHEGMHFRDKRNDQNAFMQNFEYIKQKGKQAITPLFEEKYREAFGESHPEIIDAITMQRPIDEEKPERGMMSSLDAVSYKTLHRLYNIFDDIYVNDGVENREQKYASGSGKEETQDLYKKLFPSNDHSTLPRHLSLDLLLREKMVPNESPILHPDAQKAFDNFRFLGSDLNMLIKNELYYKKYGQSDAGARYALIKQTIEPLFLELLAKDIEEWEPELPRKNGGKGNGESGEDGEEGDKSSDKPGDGEYNPNPFDSLTPKLPGHEGRPKNEDPLTSINDDLDELDKIRVWNDRDNETSDERADRLRKQADKVFDNEYKITPEIRELYDQRMREIKPYRRDMMKFWKSLIYGSGREYITQTVASKKGSLNVDQYISSYAQNQEKMRTGHVGEIKSFDRKESIEVPTQKPECINVRVVGDISGSMDDGDRMEILQKSILLLLSSVESFNKYLDISRNQTGSQLRADTQARCYNHDSKIIKEFNEGNVRAHQRQADIMNVFKYIQKASGGNDEYLVLEKINSSLTQKEKTDIKEGKMLDILFFITDGGMGMGGSHSEDDIASEVGRLIDNGVIPVGFQIGSNDKSEKAVFDKIFNQEQKQGYGIFIGSELEKLPKELMEQMKRLLTTIKI